MTGTNIGFDIGSSSMKIAVIRDGGVRIEEVRLPENMIDGDVITMPNAFSQFLKQTRRELKLPGHAPAALVLPASQVICRFVTMPKMTQDQLIMNLPYEFADFIQGAPDQYFCDYAVCENGDAENQEEIPLMAAAAAKSRLEEYIRMFARAGVRLRTMIPQEMSLIALAKHHIRMNKGRGEYCFVDLGQQRTRITVVWNDRVQATRQIALGGQDLDRIVAEELGIGIFLANSYKAAGRGEVLELPAVGEMCERIAVEILKVVNFYQFTYRSSGLNGIYLAGGGAAMEPMRRAIAGVGLEPLNAAELLNNAEGSVEAGLFAAGAAMGGAVK